MSAVRYQVLQEILRILRKDMSFVIDPIDNGFVDPIIPVAIQYRKISGERDTNQARTAEILPGIFVSTPLQEPFPEEAGTNEQDEYRWRFLVQIIDSDNHEPSQNIASYFLWQEQICTKFQFKDMTKSGNVSATRCLANASSVDVVDERYWVKEENFKSGILLTIRTWLSRG